MWDRKLWGVWFSAPRTKGEGLLISDLWANYRPVVRAEEPTRALLFINRKAAREWCKKELAKYANSDTKDWKDWKFKAVRVRETVKVVK